MSTYRTDYKKAGIRRATGRRSVQRLHRRFACWRQGTTLRTGNSSTPYFEGCLPIEVMAARGRETLRFGPMKPVGLTDPRTGGQQPHAVVQLRQDNALGTLFNMVGFQTKLTYGEQKHVFPHDPRDCSRPSSQGSAACTATPSSTARNFWMASFDLKSHQHIRFAGQITGCEGYVESAAVGLMAGRFAAAEVLGYSITPPPPTTAMGALLNHITSGADASTFQPMNINFGLFPPLEGRMKKRERKPAMAKRALTDLEGWMGVASTVDLESTTMTKASA